MKFEPTHKHFKGGLYQVITDKAELGNLATVIYMDDGGQIWERERSFFYGTVIRVGIDPSGKQVETEIPRFERLTNVS